MYFLFSHRKKELRLQQPVCLYTQSRYLIFDVWMRILSNPIQPMRNKTPPKLTILKIYIYSLNYYHILFCVGLVQVSKRFGPFLNLIKIYWRLLFYISRPPKEKEEEEEDTMVPLIIIGLFQHLKLMLAGTNTCSCCASHAL